jgi:putative ABC transport system permease protein
VTRRARSSFRLARAVYRFLLRAYPPAFRARHGDAMLDLFLAKREAVCHGASPVRRARFWLETFADVASNAIAARAAARAIQRQIAPEGRRRTIGWLAQDVRISLRRLAREPGFAVVAILTLALGIGANTVIFSAVHGVLLQPLGFFEPDRLVSIWQTDPGRGGRPQGVSSGLFVDWQQRNRTLTSLAAYLYTTGNVTGRGEPERIPIALVSPGFFETLGVPPATGRGFDAADGRTGVPPVALVSQAFWRRRFDAAADAVGRTLELNGTLYTVIGIMPAGFEHLSWRGADVWVPLTLDPASYANGNLRVIGRLAPGVTPAEARANLRAVQRQVRDAAPPEALVLPDVAVDALDAQLVHGARVPVLLLQACAILVLLVMCANLAGVLLARASARQREMAIRAALGAGRRRLARQLLTESTVLALAGGIAGLAVARWGVDLLLASLPPDTPRLDRIALDPSVLLAGLAASLVTGLGFGLLPALRVTRRPFDAVLRRGGRGSRGSASRAMGVFVIGEVALTLVLLAGAGVVSRSVAMMQQLDPGFDAGPALAAEVSLPHGEYPEPADQARFFAALERRLESTPGVTLVGLVNTVPLSQSWGSMRYELYGATERPAAALFYQVSPRYFAAMGIRVREGRAFTDRDDERAPDVAIVSETVARRHWPNGGAIGARIRVGPSDIWRQIVGVVSDVRHTGLDRDPEPGIYVPARQLPFSRGVVIVRGDLSAAALVSAVRAGVKDLDAELPLFNVRTLEELKRTSLQASWLVAVLMGGFSLLALALGAVGLYGVIAYGVTRRTHEMGVRMALGARRADIRRLFAVQGLKLVFAGLAIGMPVTLGFSPLAASLLYGVRPNDPLTLAGVSMLLLVVGAAAAYVPARRATRTDPMAALRVE